ncbi:GlsB/YeaQ/YmgE family stress response membrane protein [Asticcacaulis sp. YBE204]|uniref:GlsB/YeaQ/YmgE family stress response membrane protein n=1 Tax=Asticcacaulis sp. YBE204 TaxID=1282363 RepID=UPI0003C3DCF1|nr:transglycosylase [Asticcacaulis sp. YBE204]ESQ78161.1 transglycosylase [Asticcacaulis sp. YBE204]
MNVQDWILAGMAGFIVGWIANNLTKSRYSAIINMFVGIFGAILMTFFIHILDIYPDRFFTTLRAAVAGSVILLGLFHLTRAMEKIKK